MLARLVSSRTQPSHEKYVVAFEERKKRHLLIYLWKTGELNLFDYGVGQLRCRTKFIRDLDAASRVAGDHITLLKLARS